MKTINWGILSTGNIAHSFARDFQYSEGGIIKAVASRTVENATAFARKYKIEKPYGSYKELFGDPDIDIIYIATPHNLHFQNSSLALKSGKAVLCEKPITVNPQECQQLIELSTSTNTYLMEAMWTFFLPPILKAKEWIKNGKIGKVRHIRAEFCYQAEYDPNNRLFNPDLAGGVLLDIGIYPIAISYLIYNQLPESITVNSQKAKTGVDHEETMLFHYSDGSTAHLHASFLYNMPNEVIITGNRGYIKIPDFFMARECFLFMEGNLTEHYKDQRKSVGYDFEVNAVNQDLISGKKQSEIVPLDTSLNIQKIMAMVMKQF